MKKLLLIAACSFCMAAFAQKVIKTTGTERVEIKGIYPPNPQILRFSTHKPKHIIRSILQSVPSSLFLQSFSKTEDLDRLWLNSKDI
jgi:hypothetical protein